MTEYKPGTVAKATVRGVPDVTVFLAKSEIYPWASAQRVEDDFVHCAHDVTDVRPLVVLDLGPGSRPAQEAVSILRSIPVTPSITSADVRLLQWIADQIEKQLRPAIEEPTGLGAVVEVDGGVRFVRDPFGVWRSEDESWSWSHLNPVRVLSEGVGNE